MQDREPLTVFLASSPLEGWDEESTASALRVLAVRLHSTGLSLRETVAVLETFGVTRSHQAVFQWVHRIAEEVLNPPTAQPSQVVIDETAVTVATEQRWLYAVIDIETKLLPGIRLSERRGTDPAAVFPSQLTEENHLSEPTSLVDSVGYLTALAPLQLGKQPT